MIGQTHPKTDLLMAMDGSTIWPYFPSFFDCTLPNFLGAAWPFYVVENGNFFRNTRVSSFIDDAGEFWSLSLAMMVHKRWQ